MRFKLQGWCAKWFLWLEGCLLCWVDIKGSVRSGKNILRSIDQVLKIRDKKIGLETHEFILYPYSVLLCLAPSALAQKGADNRKFVLNIWTGQTDESMTDMVSVSKILSGAALCRSVCLGGILRVREVGSREPALQIWYQDSK